MLKRNHFLTLIVLLWAGSLAAQSPESDSLAAFRPLAAIAGLYQRSAVQLTLHLRREATPVTNASDTLETDIEMYYGLPNEYVRTEGLEEIVNDSVVLLVNIPARRMLRYHNTPAIRNGLNRGPVSWLADSSLATLAKRYRATNIAGDTGVSKTELTSRDVIAGTQLPKERITLLYRTATGLPVQCTETRVSMVPVDSLVYTQLQKQAAYSGRLLTGSGRKGRIFLIVKESSTVCSFRGIDLRVKRPPVSETDRLVLTAGGIYKPAKGFEEYVFTQEN
jgi:hypothetical protein